MQGLSRQELWVTSFLLAVPEEYERERPKAADKMVGEADL